MVTLDHIGIYVKDLGRSIQFYREAFNFPIHSTLEVGESKIAFLDTGNGLLEIIQRPEPLQVPKGRWSHLAFNVKNYSETIMHLKNLGLEIRESTLPEGTRIAFLKDPDGHDLEIDEEPFNK